ncbi:hypothetical protein V6N11_051793 [Hibiscus sabdariffa]|uniref:Uncharacterized protein n=1 Tax=Hibiscus sabdariffa TaxID=183260 RepID=A0ABR2U8C8_9ROSI
MSYPEWKKKTDGAEEGTRESLFHVAEMKREGGMRRSGVVGSDYSAASLTFDGKLNKPNLTAHIHSHTRLPQRLVAFGLYSKTRNSTCSLAASCSPLDSLFNHSLDLLLISSWKLGTDHVISIIFKGILGLNFLLELLIIGLGFLCLISSLDNLPLSFCPMVLSSAETA